MELFSLIYEMADHHHVKLDENGFAPPGHNGLYHDTETPVRNTSHWLLTYSSLYRTTGEDRFRDTALKMAEYLSSELASPHGLTFHHRLTQDKDQCNGLIGQAWTIEALAVAAEIFDEPPLAKSAAEVFLLHPQDSPTGIWKRVEIDGSILPFDATFNHQLWFAAAGGLLAHLPWIDDRVDEAVRKFLDELLVNFRTYSSGLIFHPLHPTKFPRRHLHLIRADERGRIGVTFLTSNLPIPSRRQQLRWKALGYHSFNLYAFALLNQHYSEHPFWETTRWQQALDFISTNTYRESVWVNEYGSPYNPIGFEVPFAMEVFDVGTEQERKEWITKQLEMHYSPERHRLDRNTPDGETLTARIYQATRLNDVSLTLDVSQQ